MKKRYLILLIILTFAVEVIITKFYITKKVEYTNDTIKINELVNQISDNNNIVEVKSDVKIELAKTSFVDKNQIEKQINKLGNTIYECDNYNK